jgi:hypothetical protein
MLLTLVLLSVLRTASVADSLPGTWLITGDIMGNPVKTTCMIKQTGLTLSGNCTNDSDGPYELTGEVKDEKFAFKYVVDYQGQPLTIVHSGALTSSTPPIKGTLLVQPMGATGTFTAARAPAKP